MKNLPIYCCVLLAGLLSFAAARAQERPVTIDTVFAFAPGDNATFGQDPQYFPANVFGMPAATAREDVPAATPEDVVSLGLEGVIIVGNRSYGVQDAPGPDFVIFENAFRFGLDRIYAEPAKVSVSRNGEEWFDFPCAAATLAGCAGTSPSTGDFEPFDAMRAGGDAFDLADLELDWVRYIRIEDVSRAVRDDNQHAFYDPTINGFELDAIVIVNPIDLVTDVTEGGTSGPAAAQPSLQFIDDQIVVEGSQRAAKLEVYGLDGRLLLAEDLGLGSVALEVHLRQGLYVVVLRGTSGVLARELWLKN